MHQDEALAEFVGLAYGDGSLCVRKGTNKLRFQLRGDAKEDRKHYDRFVVPLCNQLFMPILGTDVGTVTDSSRNCFGVCIESPKIKNLLIGAGLPIGPKKELSIPNWIRRSRTFTIAFLRGLFDTDGSFYCQRNYSTTNKLPIKGVISIGLCSRKLIQDVKEALDSLGINSYILKPYKPKTGNDKTSYRVRLEYKNVKKWFREIGSNNPKHLTKYKIWRQFGFCPPRTTLKDRQQILKGELNPYLYVSKPRGCESGQIG